MAGALLLAILLVSASACPASARDLRGAPPAGAAPALTAHTLAAAEAAAAAPLALAALDALDPDDLRAKAAALGRTPEQLRALVATSTAATFERDAGAVRYRCDFGGRPGGPDGRRLVLPGQTEEHEHAEAEALAAGPAGDLPGGAFLAAAMAAAMPDPGQPDPDVSEVFSLHRWAGDGMRGLGAGRSAAAAAPTQGPVGRPRSWGSDSARAARRARPRAGACAAGRSAHRADVRLAPLTPNLCLHWHAAAPGRTTRCTWTSLATPPRVRGSC